MDFLSFFLPVEKRLINAIDHGKARTVEKLLDKVDHKVKTSGENLLLSVFLRKSEIARILIRGGADVSVKDSDGWPVLICSANQGDVETVRVMIENGADVNAPNKTGWTPLMGAVYNGCFEVVKLLIDHGADINAEDNSRETALGVAEYQEYPQISKYLIEKGARAISTAKDFSLKKDKETISIHDEDLNNNQLIEALIYIGKTDGFLTTDRGCKFDQNLRNIRARAIGELLNTRGSKALMMEACEKVQSQLGPTLGRELEVAWHLIGRWYA